jgi:peroxiredoxin
MPRAGWVLVGLAIDLCGGCGEALERVEIGSLAPDFGAVDLAGDSVRLRDLRGEVTFLNVWATWCEPCREEIPALQALQERHSGQGFEVVGVSIDFAGQREKLQPFADSFGVTYTLWHDIGEDVCGGSGSSARRPPS